MRCKRGTTLFVKQVYTPRDIIIDNELAAHIYSLIARTNRLEVCQSCRERNAIAQVREGGGEGRGNSMMTCCCCSTLATTSLLVVLSDARILGSMLSGNMYMLVTYQEIMIDKDIYIYMCIYLKHIE